MREHLDRWIARLRAGILPGLAFGLVAIVAEALERLPSDIGALLAHRAGPALVHARLQHAETVGLLALVELAALLLAFRTRADLLARPARFLAVLLGAGSAALVAMACLATPGLPRGDLMRAWATLSMWSVLWGGLFFHHLRLREDDRRLTVLLARRAALGREMQESRLAQARAQLDPAVIARALRDVRARAEAGSPDDAAGLVDRLADYLRPLLQRARHGAPTLAGDLALLRAYVALQEAQRGASIDLVVDAAVETRSTAPAQGTFLVARRLLEEASAAAPRGPLRLALAAHASGITLETTLATPRDDEASALAEDLRRLHPGLAIHHEATTSGRRLVAHVPLQ